jgi:hypothetical protein
MLAEPEREQCGCDCSDRASSPSQWTCAGRPANLACYPPGVLVGGIVKAQELPFRTDKNQLHLRNLRDGPHRILRQSFGFSSWENNAELSLKQTDLELTASG